MVMKLKAYLDGVAILYDPDKEWERRGAIWKVEESQAAAHEFIHDRLSVVQISERHQRSPGSILLKLRSLGLIRLETNHPLSPDERDIFVTSEKTIDYRKRREALQATVTAYEITPIKPSQKLRSDFHNDVIDSMQYAIQAAKEFTGTPLTPTKENTMTAPKPVEVKTFIYGRESKDVPDEIIFSHISGLEQQIKTLEAIENKPKKLIKHIDQLKADIAALVKVCDERE